MQSGLKEDYEYVTELLLKLTLTLFDVHVELLQGSHRHLPDISLQQQLQQGGGKVFTG